MKGPSATEKPQSRAVSNEPNWLTKKELIAWRKFKADADAVKATALGEPWQQFEEATAPTVALRSPDTVSVEKGGRQGEHAHAERLLLNRLCSEECAEQVAAAWLGVDRHRKNPDDGQRVIKCLLDAYTRSENASVIAGDYQRSVDRLKELQGCADQLEKYFASEIARDPMWKILTGTYLSEPPDAKAALVALTRIKRLLSRRLNEFSAAFSQLDLTRKNKASTVQRITFLAAMGNAMRDIFGRPLDDVVRQLTDAVFEAQGEVTIDHVKNARRDTAKRRKARARESDGLVEQMSYYGIPITRENYLDLAYMGKPPAQLSAEEEASLPPEVRKTEP
jgi:hypothetical protein